MLFLQRNHRILFYGIWILLAIIQAAFTELQDDEAYYWVYSRYLDWGYFDHPPMIGVVVKLGYAIFPNELGVRLVPIILNVLTLVIIEKLLTKKNPFLFYAIALSLAYMQIAGFIAVPDTPLLFFTALFFLCYKKFLESQNWVNTLLLGIVMALLLYSKYHAVLIIIFTLLSNFNLLKKYQAWIAVLIASLCFVPHLWWQYEHDWVSFKYHLFESNVQTYKASYTLEYIPGQLLIAGPIAGLILLPAAFLFRPKDQTEKALRFTMIGLYIFFFLSSFRGKVEANWTSPVIIPLFVLAHQWLVDNIKWQKKLVRIVLPITLALVMIGRILMIEDILPIKAIQSRFHYWKEWPQVMKENTKGYPVVLSNSYQRASKYWFYTKQMTYSQNLYRSRRNNYNFWPVEDSMLGKPVYYMDTYEMWRFPDSMKTKIGWLGYRLEPMFFSFAKVRIHTIDKKLIAKEGDSLTIRASAEMPEHYRNFMRKYPAQPLRLVVALYEKRKGLYDVEAPIPMGILLQDEFSITVKPGLPKGNYLFRLGIAFNDFYPTQNSEKIELVVE